MNTSLFDIFWGSLARRIRQYAQWRKQGLLSKRARLRRRMRVETFEPRLLLSADLAYSAGGGVLDATLRFSEDGSALQLIDRETLAELASASLAGPDPVEVSITGGMGDDALFVDFSSLEGGTAVSIEVDFGGGDDVLTLWGGEFSAVSHSVLGSDGGSVALISASGLLGVSYLGVESVTDLTGADQRSFANDTGLQQQMRLAHDGELNSLYELDSNATAGFAPIRLLEPAATLTIRAGGEGDTLLLDGVKPDAVASVVFEGGAGNDTLVGPASDALWTVRGHNAGDLADALTGRQLAQFSGIENLTGSAAAEDSFVVEAAGSLSGLADGGSGGFDELIIRSATETVLVVPDATGSASFDGRTVAYAGLEPFVQAAGPDAVSITGTMLDDHLVLESVDAASVQIRSLGYGFLVAGAATDALPFGSPGLSLTVDLRAGDDTFALGALDAGFTASIAVTGGAGDDRVVGADAHNEWRVQALDAGSLNSGDLVFSAVEHLVGGSQADTFTVEAGGRLSGGLSGGGGANELRGPAQASAWILTGLDAGELRNAANGELRVRFEQLGNLTGAADIDDDFVVERGAVLSGLLDGGSGGSDSLVIHGVSFSAWVVPDTAGAGSAVLDGASVTYAGIEGPVEEPVAGGTVVGGTFLNDNLMLEADPDNAGHTRLRSEGAGILFFLLGGFSESLSFAHPATSLTVNLKGGSDTLTIHGFATGLGSSLVVEGGLGNDSIIVAENALISSRAIAGEDHLTAASTGDSGQIVLGAETIEVRSGAKLLAHALAGSGAAAPAAGNITLRAEDRPTDLPLLGFFDLLTTVSSITLDDAMVKGAVVTLLAESRSAKLWSELGPGFDMTIGLLDGLNEFGGVALANADATIGLTGATDIEAADVQIHAKAYTQAEVTTTSVAVSVSLAESNPSARVTVGDGVEITSIGHLTIATEAESVLEAQARQSALGPNKPTTAFDITLAAGQAAIEATSWVQSGAQLEAGGDLRVSAAMHKKFNVAAKAGAYEDGSVGGAIALSSGASAVNAVLDGDADAFGDVTVEARTVIERNETHASADVGSGFVAKAIIGAKDKAGLSGATGSFFQSNNPQPDSRSQQPAKFALAAAFAYADHENLSLARIDAGAEVRSETGSVALTSTILDRPKIVAIASIDSQKIAAANPIGNNKENSLSAALTIGHFSNYSDAHIGEGAVVDARDGVVVRSETSIPLVIDWLQFAVPQGSGAGELASFAGDLASDIGQHLNGNFGLENGIFTSWAQAKAQGEKTAGAFSVNVFNIDNSSHAYIAEGASINQDAALRSSEQNVRVEAVNLVEAVHLSGIVGLGFGSQGGQAGVGGGYLEIDYGGTVTAQIHSGVQLYADTLLVRADSKTHNFSVAAALGKAGDLGINGAFSLVRENNRALARIDDGAFIEIGSGELEIPRVVRERFTEGTVGLLPLLGADPLVEDTLLALDSNGDGAVDADDDDIEAVLEDGAGPEDDVFLTNLSQLVVAEDESTLINIAGGVTAGNSIGVGFSIAINEIGRDTQALVGNRASAFDGASVDADEDTIGFNGPHGYVTGEAVEYDPGASAPIAAAGLYYAVVVDPRTIRLAQTRADAFAETPVTVDLSVGAEGEAHTLRSPDDAAGSLDAGGKAKIAAVNQGTISAWSVAGSVITAGSADPQGQEAPKKSGKYGFGLSLNVSVNTIDDLTHAFVEGATLTGDGGLAIVARDTTNILAVAGAVAVSTVQTGIGGAGAWTQNSIRTDTAAFIKDSSVELAGGLAVEADNAAKILGISASLSGAGKAGVAGSVSVNHIEAGTLAYIEASDIDVLPGGGQVDVAALNASAVHAIAGAPAFGGKAGIGASVAWNTITSTTEALVTQSDIDTPEGISLLADTASEILAGSAALAVSPSGSLAAAVAVSVNTINDRTRAAVSGKRLEGLFAGGDVAIEATGASTIFSFAGGVGGAGQGAGVGISTSVNVVNSEVEAAIIGAAVVESSDGSVRVEARQLPAEPSAGFIVSALEFFGLPSTSSITSGAIGGGVASSFGAAGSVSFNVVNSEVRAQIGARQADYVAGEDPEVTAFGDVSVLAQDDLVVSGGAGAVTAAGSGLGIGISNVTLLTDNTVEAFIGVNAEVDARAMREGDVGISVSALSTEHIRTAAVGGALGTTGGAGSVTFTKLDEKTRAFVDRGAQLNQDGGGAARQDVSVRASDDTTVFAVAGALGGGGTAGIGAGADILLLEKQTEARIGASAQVAAQGSVFVDAASTEDLSLTSAALGAGGSAGIAGAASASRLDVTTRAFIGPDAEEALGAATVVSAEGNVAVTAEGDTEIDLAAGNITGSGSVSVGASGAVPIVFKRTEAFIGREAQVDAKAQRNAVEALTGAFAITYEDPAFSFGEVPAPLFFVDGTLAADVNFDGTDDLTDASFTQQRVSTPQTRAVKGVAVSAVNRDDIEAVGLSGGGAGALSINVGGSVSPVTVETSASVDAGAQINTGTDEVGEEQSVLVAAGSDFSHMGMALAAGGGGSGAVVPGIDVTLLHNRTHAYVGHGAQVHAAQDIAVLANSLQDVLSLSAGGAGSGLVAVGGALSVVSIDSGTWAHIGDGLVEADLGEPGMPQDPQTQARAGGSILVSAADHTDTDVVAGSLGIGIGGGGVGASLIFVTVDKDTQAYIAEHAQVDAAGSAGAGLSRVLNGELEDTGAGTEANFRGVAVQAEASELVFTLAATVGGGFYAGVAGALTVETIDADTRAYIGAGAQVNQDTPDAHEAQSVNVSAYNDVQVFSFAGGLGGGAVGVGGAVDIGVLRNDTSASIGAGAEVDARKDVDVNAVARKDVESVVVSAAGGLVGGAGSVSVWAVGAPFESSYSDGDNSADALEPASEADGNSQPPQYANAQGFVDAMAGGGDPNNGYGVILEGHAAPGFDPQTAVDAAADTIDLGPDHELADGDAVIYRSGEGEPVGGLVDGQRYYVIATDDPGRVQLAATQEDALDGVALDLDPAPATGSAHELRPLLGDAAGGAGEKIRESAPQDEVADATGSAEVEAGTTAFIAAGARVAAGGDVGVRATDRADFGVFAGGVAAGVGGVGASVAVANLRSATDAHISGEVDAGGEILVCATFTGDASGAAFAGQLGLITLGAQVVVINDTSEQLAYIGDGAILSGAETLTVSATATRALDARATGGGIAGAAAGWAHAAADIGGGTLAYIGDATVTGVDDVAVTADSDARASAEARAVAGGIVFGASGVTAAATVDPTVRALVASGASIDATGDVEIAALSAGDADAHAGGITIGGLGFSIGSSQATALLNPDVAAYIADAVVIAGAGIALRATHNVAADRSPATDTDGRVLGARANANASGGSLFADNGATAVSQASPEVRAFVDQRAQVGAGADLSLLAAANNQADAEASGLTISLGAGLGTSVATAEANGITAAFIGPNPFAADPGLPNPLAFSAFNLLIEASASNSAQAAATAPGGGLVGILGAAASATVSPTIEAFIGDGVAIAAQADVSLLSHSEGDAEATSGNFTLGLIASVGSATTVATVTPDIDTYVGAGAVVDAGGSIALQSRHNYGADGAVVADKGALADSTASGGGIVGISPASAQATADANVLTAVNTGAVLRAGQGIALQSRANNEADATADGSTGGVVAVGDMTATATATGTTVSALSAAQLTAVSDVSIFAKGTNRADALAESANGGVVAVRVTLAEADAAPTVRATLFADDAQTQGGLLLDALALGDASAESNGVGGGLVDVASADAIAKWRPTVEAAIEAGTALSAAGDVGVRAYNNHNEAGTLQSSRLVQSDARATGGGVVSAGPSADAETIVDADVLARVGSGAVVAAGQDLDIIAKSRNNADAEASGINGGVISAGFPSATITLTNHARAVTEDATGLARTTLSAGQDLRLRSHSDSAADAEAFGGSGGLGAFASTRAEVQVFDNQVAVRVGDHSDLSASGTILLEALKSVQAYGLANGQVVLAVQASNRSTADVDVDLVTQVEIGEGATLQAAEVQIHAKVVGLDVDGETISRTNTLNTTSLADSQVDVTSLAAAIVESGAHIAAGERIEIIVRQDGVDVDSDADGKIVGFTGTVLATAHNDLDLDSNVEVQADAVLVSDDIFIQAESPKTETIHGQVADADAATVVQWIANTVTQVRRVTSSIPIIGWIVRWITETITLFTRVVLNSNESSETPGEFTSDNSIHLAGDVFQGASSSPRLLVNADGTLEALGGVSAEVVGDTVVVDDIAGSEGAGSIVLSSPGGAVSGNGTIHKNSLFAEVSIVNHSALNLRVNDIRSINPNPLQADIQIESDPSLDTSDFSVVSDLGTAGESPQVTIHNHGASQLVLAGQIENPTGGTTILNEGGNIVMGLSGAYLEGQHIRLQAAGDIGSAGERVYLRLYADAGAAALDAQAGGAAYLQTRLLEIGEAGTPVPAGHVIERAVLDVTAQADVDILALQAQVLIPSEEPGGISNLFDVGGTYWLPQVASAGGHVAVQNVSGDLGIGQLDAHAGTVIATASGLLFDFEDDAASDVNALDMVLAAGAAVGAPGNALQIDSNGSVTVSATQGIHLAEVAGDLVAQLDSGGGPVDVTAPGSIDLRELMGDLRVGHIASANGDVYLEAVGAIRDGHVAGANLRFDAQGGAIVLAVDSDGVVKAEAVHDIVLAEATGDLVLDLLTSSLGMVQLTAPGAIRDGAATSISAVGAVLAAGVGIGASDNPLDTQIGALEADAGAGGLWLVNTGALVVGEVTADGELSIVALSPMLISGDVVGESVYLEAANTPGTGDDLVVQAGASIAATAGDVVLVAGDDVTVEAGSVVVSAQGAVSLSAGGNLELSGVIDADSLSIVGSDGDNVITITRVTTHTTVQALGGNDTVVVGGGSVDAIGELLVIDGGDGSDVLGIDETADAGPNQGRLTSSTVTGLGMSGSVGYALFEEVQVRLGDGEDVFTVASTHAGTTSVHGGAGDDTVTVGEGDLATIGGLLAVDGGQGADALIVDDADDVVDNVGVLTAGLLAGLGLSEGIAYAVERLDIELGAGADAFYVRGTGAVTNLRLNGGDDRIYVSDEGRLDGIQGALNIDAGAGRHRLEISDAAATVGDGDVLITDLQPAGAGLSDSAEIWITGLAPAGISFEASRTDGNFFDGIEIRAGSGDDRMHVDGTHERDGGLTTTLLHTGAGDDEVSVALDAGEDGALLLYVGEGDDSVDAAASTLALVLIGGDGDDQLTGGSAEDLIFGDHAEVDIENGAGTNPRWRALAGDTLYDAAGAVQVGAEQAVPGGSPYWEGFGIRVLEDAGGDDVISGGAGNDQIFGQAGDDWLSGDEGEDYIEGNAGNDSLYGGAGQDDLVGGSSSLFGAAERADGSDLIHGGEGADVIVGDNGNIYRIVGVQFAYDPAIHVRAVELLDYAMGAADEIHGDGGDDAIYGQRGDDELHGDDGDDDLIGGQGNDAIWGGAGRDGILGDEGRIFTSRNGTAEPLYGIAATTPETLTSPGNLLRAEIYVDGELNKSVYLAPPGPEGDGEDVIDGGLDGDWLHGGGGNDVLSGAEGDDAVFGGQGNDQLIGGLGNDHLYGGLGDDVLDAGGDGSAFQDIAFGGDGSDRLIGGASDRLIDWVGNSNTFVVPSGSKGALTVLRMPAPWMVEFLEALARADGYAEPATAPASSSIDWTQSTSDAWSSELSPYAQPARKNVNFSDYLVRTRR